MTPTWKDNPHNKEKNMELNDYEIVCANRVQYDNSGVGHNWQACRPDDMPTSILAELAAWIIEDDPNPGDEYTTTGGQAYRILPAVE
jgi:hypothetical protein